MPLLSPKSEIRPSPIQGRGLFAKKPISQGEVVAVKLSNQHSAPDLIRVVAAIGLPMDGKQREEAHALRPLMVQISVISLIMAISGLIRVFLRSFAALPLPVSARHTRRRGVTILHASQSDSRLSEGGGRGRPA